MTIETASKSDEENAIIEWLLTRVAETSYEDLPDRAIEKTKTFLLDTFGVGVAGCHGFGLDRIRDLTRAWGQGDEATVWVSGERVPAPTAAFLNGYQIHSLEFDCLCDEAVMHPMATMMSAVMAHVERRSHAGRPVSGQDLIRAVVLGIDLAVFLGLASRQRLRFFRPATAGGFGAAAAISLLEGFDREGLRQAMGHQYGQMCGTMQAHVEGSPQLGLQIGYNARAALISVDMVKAAIPAPKQAFLGEHGYFRLVEGDAYDLQEAKDFLEAHHVMERMAHKPFPSGRLTHGTIDALTTLMSEHGFGASDVERVVLTMPSLVYRLMGRPDVPEPEPNYAKLCLPFVSALAMRFGDVTIEHFLSRDILNDPATHALAGRVEMVQDENPDENAMMPQRIEVYLSDGTSHDVLLTAAIGHPDKPLSEERNVEKFLACLRYAGRLPEESAARVIEAVKTIENCPDVAQIVPFLVALPD
ncbi:MmgE/PrpD family protein [Celeribacter litoreus]|uniref:MmgE/PrpD family protein n=1 Tax=Celeribacter litoreus TaxID=2876714 RepID=UPI001CCCDD77|nr:MmgE/PrpD family protein [Celeribacter litoreus]MCA0042519.1 MmgE/PrpD family protein [Celeribacter litoreus]